MRTKITKIILFIHLCSINTIIAQYQIKDVTSFQDLPAIQLIGYGIITELDNTGDGKKTFFAVQSVANTLRRFGINIDLTKLKEKTVAAVLITAKLPIYHHQTIAIHVNVKRLGDATHLQDGILQRTPLLSPEGTLYAFCQGTVTNNNLTTNNRNRRRQPEWRIENGLELQQELPRSHHQIAQIFISLKASEKISSQLIAESINKKFFNKMAKVHRNDQVSLDIPPAYQSGRKFHNLLKQIEEIQLPFLKGNRVVINQSTGLVLNGESAIIKPVIISQGKFNIEVQDTTQTLNKKGKITCKNQHCLTYIDQKDNQHSITIHGFPTVKEMTTLLQTLKITPDEMVKILQQIKNAGALRAELVIQ